MSTLNGGPGNIVTNGLVLYLDAANYLSYTSGSTVWRDLSSSNNSGSLINGPTFSSGNAGSIVFDGTNDYCGFSSFDFGNELTVFCFIKPSLTNDIQSIFANSVGGFLTNGIRLFTNSFITNSKNITLEVGNGTTGFNIITNNDVILYDSWQQIAFTLSKTTGNGFIYYNGNPIKNGTLTVTNYNSNGVFRLGLFTNGQFPFKGSVATYILYNRALTASEVLQNYNATKGRFGL